MYVGITVSIIWKLIYFWRFTVPGGISFAYLTICLIILLSILLMQKPLRHTRLRPVLMALLWGFTVVTTHVSVCFYRMFAIPITLSLLKIADDLNQVPGSVLALLSFEDLALYLCDIALVAFWLFPSSRRLMEKADMAIMQWQPRKLAPLMIVLGCFWISQSETTPKLKIFTRRGAEGVLFCTPLVFYSMEGVRELYLACFPDRPTPAEQARIEKELLLNREKQTLKAGSIPRMKEAPPGQPNIIAIQWESLMTIARNQSVDGIQVAPFLDRVASEGIYCTNYYSAGFFTAEADFGMLTSLHPLAMQYANVGYFQQPYRNLARHLRQYGYHTFWGSGSNKKFWNSERMMANLGFERMRYLEDLAPGTMHSFGRADDEFLQEMVGEIASLPSPFFAMMPTISSHHPFHCENLPKLLRCDASTTEEVELRNYFNTVHFTDRALAAFINSLNEKGLMNNTILLIYGDHQVPLARQHRELVARFGGLPQFEMLIRFVNSRIPCVLWSPGLLKATVLDKVVSQVDLAPTLLDILGYPVPVEFLGESVFKSGEGAAIYKSGIGISRNHLFFAQDEEKEQYFRAAALDTGKPVDPGACPEKGGIEEKYRLYRLSEKMIEGGLTGTFRDGGSTGVASREFDAGPEIY